MIQDSQKQHNQACERWKDNLKQLIDECFENQSEEQKQDAIKYFQSIKEIFPKQYLLESIQVQNIRNQQLIDFLITYNSTCALALAASISAESTIVATTTLRAFALAALGPISTAIFAGISVYQISATFKNINFLSKIKEKKLIMREIILKSIDVKKSIDFSDLEQILYSQYPDQFKELPLPQLVVGRKCTLFYLVFNSMQKTIIQKHYKTFVNKTSNQIFDNMNKLYQQIMQADPHFSIDFHYVFGKKEKLSESDIKNDLRNHKKHQKQLNLVGQVFISKGQEIFNLYKGLVTLRNINSFFIIKMIISIYFKEFVNDMDVIKFFSDEDKIKNLVNISS